MNKTTTAGLILTAALLTQVGMLLVRQLPAHTSPLKYGEPLPATITDVDGHPAKHALNGNIAVLCHVDCGACYRAARDSTAREDLLSVVAGQPAEAKQFLVRSGLSPDKVLVAVPDELPSGEAWMQRYRLTPPTTVQFDDSGNAREIWVGFHAESSGAPPLRSNIQ